MNDDWLSAHLDGELTDAEAAEVDAALVADPVLAADLDHLRRIRHMLRDASITPPEGSIERIVAAIRRVDSGAASGGLA